MESISKILFDYGAVCLLNLANGPNGDFVDDVRRPFDIDEGTELTLCPSCVARKEV